MAVKQISVFLENKKGRLIAVTECLAKHQINIHALSAADTADFGILRLIVDQPEAALKAFRADDFTVLETEVLVVRVADRPGGLNAVLKILYQADINVDYIYAFYNMDQATALNIIKVDDMESAAAALTAAGVSLLHDEDFDRV
jgi:hypothetical protein